jgi:hypothetical protein
MAKKVILFITVFLLVFAGPAVLVNLVRVPLEGMLALDCSSSSGGSLPFPATPCGKALLIPIVAYYMWFAVPVPLVIPFLASMFLYKYFQKKFDLR